jgi:hypothetical protein
MANNNIKLTKKPGNPHPSNTFAHDPERARAAGRKSKRTLPEELKAARQLNATVFEEAIYKYMDKNVSELSAIAKDPTTSARDLVIIKILILSIQGGDIGRFNFLLDRTIGRIQDNIKVESEVTVRTLHDAIIRKIESKK